ncbi:hypothetical protein B7767_18885 [Streptomyces sp. 13-12-16]|nr:hypothetical protein B7767_18885 [Streptomyces sp. 13-12-16]
MADPGPSLPSAPTASPDTPSPPPSAKPSPGHTPERTPDRENPDPEPQGTSSATAAPGTTARGEPAACHVDYDLVNQWPDGFQATVTVTTREPLDSWRVGFALPDGQRITRMWDASPDQDGSRVTATAADYNKSVAAGGRLAFGFLASHDGTNHPPSGFTLNGRTCATV